MSNIYKINISTVKHQYQQTRNIGSTLPPRNKLVSHWIMPYSHCWPKNLYPLLWIQLFNIRKLWNLNYMLIEIKNAYRSPAVFLIHSYLGPQVGFICPLPVWALAFDPWLWPFSFTDKPRVFDMISAEFAIQGSNIQVKARTTRPSVWKRWSEYFLRTGL